MRRLDLEKTLALSAMTVALTVLALYAAGLFRALAVPCCIFSLLFLYALSYESLYLWGLVCYALAAAITALLTNGGWPFLFYALLGHYGLFKTFIDKKIRDPITRSLLKMAYGSAWILTGLILGVFALGLDLSQVLPEAPLWLLVLGLELALFILDILYSLWQRVYEARIRNAILPRK